MKAFADDNLIVIKMMIYVLDRVEKIVGKGENAGNSIFSFSHSVFKSLLDQGCQNSRLCGKELITLEKKDPGNLSKKRESAREQLCFFSHYVFNFFTDKAKILKPHKICCLQQLLFSSVKFSYNLLHATDHMQN